MKKRIPELDGLRVIMIFIVSWYHIWQQSWLTPSVGSYSLDWLVRSGYVWVDGTVLLSSFLLYLPYARAGRKSIPEPAVDFYKRRACRILPSYYFILLLVFFAVALPFGLYSSPQFMVKDLATHFTFTFNFWYDSYIGTQLGAACWTLAVEVQAYLLFPLIVRAIRKKPVLTLSVMALVCFGFRAWVLWSLADFSIVVNQLINFLDVYVIGILSAMAYSALERRQEPEKTPWPWRTVATLVFVGCVFALVKLLRVQAGSGDYFRIQSGQMTRRPLFALCFAGMILSADRSLLPLRFLLGNPVMKFLAGISMNYYLIHQTLIVHLKRLHFPVSISEQPNMAGERLWQQQYTLLSFGLSLILAILITYLVEKPGAKLLRRLLTPRPVAGSGNTETAKED